MLQKIKIIVVVISVILIASIIGNILLINKIEIILSNVERLNNNNQQLKISIGNKDKEIYEEKEDGRGITMMQKFYECKTRCHEGLGDYDISVVSKCKNDCRIERDRVLKEINADSTFNVDEEFKINFYDDYNIDVVSIPYELINLNLGEIIGVAIYDNIYSQHVYNVKGQGYRVVPFPYITENDEIKKITGLNDLYFFPDGNYLDCGNNKHQISRCDILKKEITNDLADKMIPAKCSGKHCKFLLAIRTHNPKHCHYISQYSPHKTDKKWIKLCEDKATIIELNKTYSKDSDNIYCNDRHCNDKIIQIADVDTFEIIGNEYSRDKKNVYFYSKIIKEADSNSFKFVFENLNEKNYIKKYTKDKNFVYFNGEKIKGANPNTFWYINESNFYYLKDKENIFWQGKKLEDADLETFKIISSFCNTCAKDKNFVYLNGKKIEYIDMATFELLNYQYAKDKNNVYKSYSTGIAVLEDVDPNTFELK